MTALIRRWTVRLVLILLVHRVAAAAEVLRVDHVMHRDPEFRIPAWQRDFDPRLKKLWREALLRPETELQRMAADTIAVGHQRGVPDLRSTAPELLKIVLDTGADANVRRAAAHALVVLDARDLAKSLAQAAEQGGVDLKLVIEPALTRWADASLLPTWRKRIQDPESPSHLRILALEGLAALKDAGSQPGLLEIVRDPRGPSDQRLAAARATAAISNGGLLDAANQLLSDKSPKGITNRVLGVYLLGAHREEAAINLLTNLAADPEPTVAAAALERIYAVDPKLVFPLAPQAIQSTDVNVRRVGARALIVRADVAGIESIAPLLDDPNPSLRRFVAKSLFDLAAQAELRAAVISVAEKQLRQESWRGLEQAALLLGYLNHQPAAPRLIELLPNPREEVAVSTAWSLGRLKIPETLPAILEHANRQQVRHQDPKTLPHEIPIISAQLAQLFQLFGETRSAEADPLLRLYLPKRFGLGDSRPAACWALGKIHEGKSLDELAEKFSGRLSDLNPLMPEENPVRQMCAVGLGRLKGESQLQTLRGFSSDTSELVSVACWWSIQRITGETPPEWKPPTRRVAGWFLEPLDGTTKP